MRFGKIELIVFIALSSQSILNCAAQINPKDHFSAGIVYGPKAAYKIDAPANWVLDNDSGVSEGLPCVLYLAGFTWENSPVIMYAKIASPTFSNIDKFIDFAIKYFEKEDSHFYHKQFKTGLMGQNKYVIMNYRGGPYKSFERVLYIQMQRAVGYVVFSARNKEDFDKYADAILDVQKSYQYKPEFINYKGK